MRYTVVIIRPTGYRFSDCFLEVAETLMYGLRELGHEAEIRENKLRRESTHIFLGPHLVPNYVDFPEGSILYNLEQVDGGNIGCLESLAKRYAVWDYSAVNVEAWKKRGAWAKHVPIGYAPELSRIEPKPQTIDVLFYGSINERRKRIVDELRRMGFNVVARINDAYGKALESLIARAKIVLNVHFYESKIFEIVRVGYALANKKAVVSEVSADDYPHLREGLEIAPYAKIVASCEKLLKSAEERTALARRGFELFSKVHEAEYLKVALDAN